MHPEKSGRTLHEIKDDGHDHLRVVNCKTYPPALTIFERGRWYWANASDFAYTLMREVARLAVQVRAYKELLHKYDFSDEDLLKLVRSREHFEEQQELTPPEIHDGSLTT